MPTNGSASEPDAPSRSGRQGGSLSRVTLVAGKGGVGRSTVAAGLATAAAANGDRVLAIDAVDDGGLEAALGKQALAESQLECLRLNTEDSLAQYIDLFLPLPISPTRLGPVARILEYVAAAAPGVREILLLGKVAWELREGLWDHIIVDAPATGHVIEFLAAADNLGELIGTGPLAAQTDWMAELISDAERWRVVVVTAAEELPVTETLELVDRLRSETRAAVVGLVANRVPVPVERSKESDRLLAAGDGLAVATAVAIGRSTSWTEQRDRLNEIDLPMVSIGDVAGDGRSVDAVMGQASIVMEWDEP